MNNVKKTHYLDVLQIFRGIAALMVVLHHSVASLKYYPTISYPYLDFLAYIGKFGVDFFFIILVFLKIYTAISTINSITTLFFVQFRDFDTSYVFGYFYLLLFEKKIPNTQKIKII